MLSEKKLDLLRNKKILVTGGCGFIGSEVTKQLSQLGAKVTVLDNLSSGKEEYIQNLPNVELIKGDLLDDQLVDSTIKNKDFVINMAALPFIPDSYFFPKEFFEVNVNATISLSLKAVENNIERFIHISSSEVYGSARSSPMDENHPTIPQSSYAVSKLAGERVVYTIHKEHNLPSVIIRPFNSFGPNITQPYIIPEIINQFLQGKNPLILGNIHSSRDFTFVSDTARGIILSLVTDGILGQTINIGSEQVFSINDLVQIISKILNKKVEIEIDSSRFRPHDVETLICDYGKANRLLGWKPEISFQDGLKLTIDWASEHGISLKQSFKGWSSTYRKNLNSSV